MSLISLNKFKNRLKLAKHHLNGPQCTNWQLSEYKNNDRLHEGQRYGFSPKDSVIWLYR